MPRWWLLLKEDSVELSSTNSRQFKDENKPVNPKLRPLINRCKEGIYFAR